MNKIINMRQFLLISLSVTLVLLGFSVTESDARQFRLLTPITSPELRSTQIPEGTKPVDNIQPLPRQEVEPLVREVIEQWNTSEMANTISDQFYDKSRLMDVMDTGVPRDAKLRIQSIQGIQTLEQYIKPGAGNERGDLVSIVSATVRTQLEFNSSTSGFVSRTGTNEFILEVTTAAPP